MPVNSTDINGKHAASLDADHCFLVVVEGNHDIQVCLLHQVQSGALMDESSRIVGRSQEMELGILEHYVAAKDVTTFGIS